MILLACSCKVSNGPNPGDPVPPKPRSFPIGFHFRSSGSILGISHSASLGLVDVIPPKQQTWSRWSRIEGKIAAYYEKNGGFPESLDKLSFEEPSDANKGSKEETLQDAWGRPHIYTIINEKTFRLVSYGADGKPGGTDEDEDFYRDYTLPYYTTYLYHASTN